jgi:hypothetical protein
MPDGSVSGHGHVQRAVATSALYRTFTSPPHAPASMLEESWILNTARRLPGVWVGALAAGGTTVLVGIFLGEPVLAWMGLAFTVGVAAPRVAILLLPAVLIGAPRLNLAAAADEALFLRLDQALVFGLLVHAVFHRRGRLYTPPAHSVFVAFLAVIAASTLPGIARNTLGTPVSSLLYLGQWLEFYALYVVTYTMCTIHPALQRQAVYAWALPLLALSGYGIAECLWPFQELPDIRYRTFERVWFPGQANHAAGLFALATASGLALARSPRYRVLGLLLALMATLALLPTGSRSGAVAWAAGLTALALVLAPPLRWWTPPLGLLAMASLPSSFWGAVFAPGTSMYDRLIAWKSAMSTVSTYPLLGLGAGARHRSYYDNHYIMTLAESGLVGLVLLLLLLLSLAHALGHAGRTGSTQRLWQVGALAGLAALATHGLATATFIVTMVAGPFFWLAAVALARPGRHP